jgi:hypothetical protein
MAADIQSKNIEPWELGVIAEMVPCFKDGGIIVYKRHVHLDVRGERFRG